jgi:hypothetical protein
MIKANGDAHFAVHEAEIIDKTGVEQERVINSLVG